MDLMEEIHVHNMTFKLWQGWGKTVAIGIYATPKMLPLHPMELFDGRSIIGTVFGDFKGKSQLADLAEDCMKGVSNSYTIQDTNIM